MDRVLFQRGKFKRVVLTNTIKSLLYNSVFHTLEKTEICVSVSTLLYILLKMEACQDRHDSRFLKNQIPEREILVTLPTFSNNCTPSLPMSKNAKDKRVLIHYVNPFLDVIGWS